MAMDNILKRLLILFKSIVDHYDDLLPHNNIDI